MSQKLLADRAGLSQSYISALENGERPLDRKQTQVAIARALNISVAQLLGDPAEPADPLKDRALEQVPALRAVLVEIGSGEIRPAARDADTVRAAVVEVTELRNAADYAALTPLLPGLLRDLAGHGTVLAPQMVETLFATRYALKTMGMADLAREAAQLGVRVAAQYDDPAWTGQAAYNLVQSFPPESAALGADRMAREAQELAGRGERPAQEMRGCLHILAGFEAAIGADADTAWGHLAEAEGIARSLGEPRRTGVLTAGINGNWFGPAQVLVWQVALAAELGDVAQAQRAQAAIDLDVLPVPNRHVYYWIDMARALASGNLDQEAMRALARAERAAPQHFRMSPVVRNLAGTLIERAKRRAVAQDFYRTARSLGVA